MAVNSPGGYPPVSPKPHTPKSPRHFVFPQKSPSITSSTSSSGYYTPQSGCSYDKHNQPKSPIAHGHRSPMSPRHFNFPQKSPSGRSSPCNPLDRHQGLHYSASLKHSRREKSRSPKPPPVHIHTNPGYVSPNRTRKLYGSTSTVSSPRLVTSPSIVSSHTDDSMDAMPGTPSAIINDADDEATTISSRICRKSTSDLTDMTDDTPQTRSTSISRPCSPMRRGSMKGGLAYLASRRGSRESTVSNCDSVEDIGPLNFQNTMRGRQRRTSNFLELPVVEHSRPRVCSLPEKPYNPRISDDLYRLRTFSITTKGGVVLTTLCFLTPPYTGLVNDDEFGEKSVSVLLDGEESELIFIDHPSTEMSSSFTRAGEILAYLARELFTTERTVVLVGNKADLARARQEAKPPKLASSRTHISLNIARELLQKICINDISKSKSCENLHVL
ncbi:hypothetical protein MSG28_013766 [Choristoneura fumiferana]|uniref:Uncharacterized protein n=1 Tax=Choristoneura fumiferana TaxID=7141 RepID=A0ACC0K8N2_CHOFU|nr:hypothetical protein MSG28_013766 [Choristoneura fumiferana]